MHVQVGLVRAVVRPKEGHQRYAIRCDRDPLVPVPNYATPVDCSKKGVRLAQNINRSEVEPDFYTKKRMANLKV